MATARAFSESHFEGPFCTHSHFTDPQPHSQLDDADPDTNPEAHYAVDFTVPYEGDATQPDAEADFGALPEETETAQ
jgi:hypothetical protein